MVATQALLLLASFTAAGSPQLLCFGASWCQPCREMQPVLDRLTREGYPLRTIDVDRYADLAKTYQVAAVPSFVLVDGQGRIVDRIDQATSLEHLTRMLTHYRIAPVKATIRGQSPADELRQGIRVANVPRTATGAAPPADRTATDETARIESVAETSESTTGEALASTVRLKVEDDQGFSFGSGTVIDVHGDEALILTCGHIFRPSQGQGRILMDRFDSRVPEPTTGSLISYDMDLDIGLVSMKLTRPIRVAKLAPLDHKPHKAEQVFSVGCSKGEAPTVVEGRVNQVDKYLGAPNITASGRPVDGRSGGGLFNRRGELIGVCSAADPEIDEGLYAALPRVYHELDRNGLAFVYQNTVTETGGSQVASVNDPDSSKLAHSTNTQPHNSELKTTEIRAVVPVASTDTSAVQTSNESVGATGAGELVCVLRMPGIEEPQVFVIKNPSKILLEYLSREAAKD